MTSIFPWLKRSLFRAICNILHYIIKTIYDHIWLLGWLVSEWYTLITHGNTCACACMCSWGLPAGVGPLSSCLVCLDLGPVQVWPKMSETFHKPHDDQFAVNRSCETEWSGVCLWGSPSIWNPHPGSAGCCACPNLSHQIEVWWFPRLSFDGDADDRWRFTVCLFFVWKKNNSPNCRDSALIYAVSFSVCLFVCCSYWTKQQHQLLTMSNFRPHSCSTHSV